MPTHEPTGFWYPDAATAAGKPGHTILWYGRRRPLSLAEVCDNTKLEEEAVLARMRIGSLLGLPVGPEEVLFPAWQFDDRRPGQIIAGLCEILSIAPHDPWGVADLLTSRQPSLDERVPVSALRGGADRGRHRITAAAALLACLQIVRRAYE